MKDQEFKEYLNMTEDTKKLFVVLLYHEYLIECADRNLDLLDTIIKDIKYHEQVEDYERCQAIYDMVHHFRKNIMSDYRG